PKCDLENVAYNSCLLATTLIFAGTTLLGHGWQLCILLVSGRHVTSLCQQSLNIFTFLPLYSWCVVLRRRQSLRQSRDKTVSAGPYNGAAVPLVIPSFLH
ncbi:hypothetical protein PROFUN_05961, partial [Planoprotostelium fungivorum]